MTRRASLPGASELFRTTGDVLDEQVSADHGHVGDSGGKHAAETEEDAAQPSTGSGRKKHDSKITVYLSGTELLALEQARLTLRAEYDIAVDRGRIVREAIAALLTDFDTGGADSALVSRLRPDTSADRQE